MGTFAETAIVNYCLSLADQGKKCPFSICVCSKQMEVYRFRFPFAEYIWKLPFSVSSIFCLWKHGDIDMETWTLRHGHGDMDMETWTWRHGRGDLETWRHGDRDMETWRHGNMETWRHRHEDMETGRNGDMETSNRKRKPR
jgi:hypothetical protein